MERRLSLFLGFLVLVLLLRLFLFYSTKPEYKDGEHINFTTQVSSVSKLYKSFQSLTVKNQWGDTIFVNTEISPEYNYGDKILISGNLKIKLLDNKRKILSLDSPQIESVKSGENNLLAVVNFIRQKIIHVFQSVLPKNSAGLLLGIVFGMKEDLSRNFLDDLKISGVMHVIAASGMNVTLVGGFIFYFFQAFLKRQIAVLITILGILFYAFLAGFEASIIRASIMGIIAFSAQVLGRQKYSMYALFLTGFIMLFISPNFLFDIGFQLSFASTLGILYIPNLFKRWRNILSQDFLTTFSAQLAALPILLSNFGTYSIWSIVANVLLLWTVPILMILGGLAAIISFFFEPLARFIIYLCLPFLVYFEKVVSFFASLDGKIDIQFFPWQFSVCYYLFLFSIFFFAFKKESK